MKTFNKAGNITKEAYKARFPKYIAYFDGSALNEKGVVTKALEETDMIPAMQRIERASATKAEKIHLCGIYQKTDKVSDIGEPLYEMVIGARMTEEYGCHKLGGWHLWDSEHGETAHPLSCWYSVDFGRDDVEVWSRKGGLNSWEGM